MNYKYYIKIIINVISDTTFLLWKILIFREVMEIFPRQFLIPIRILILRIKRNVGDFFPSKCVQWCCVGCHGCESTWSSCSELHAMRLFFVLKQEILTRNLTQRRRLGSKSNLIFIPMTSVLLRTKEFHLKWKGKECAGQRPWQTAELNK